MVSEETTFGAFHAVLRAEQVRDALARWLSPGAVVVDVGCGDGALGLALLPERGSLVGVDFDRPRLRAGEAEARRRDARAAFVEADVRRLPVADAAAHVVLLYGIVELVPDSEAVIMEASRVLSRDGAAFLVVPNPLSPVTLLDDPHAHLPFSHLLPQAVAERYANLFRRRVKERGLHFALPSAARLFRAFRRANLRAHLVSNLYKVERPDAVISPSRRRVARLLRAARFERLARTRLGLALVSGYDRYVARSWAFVLTKDRIS